MKYRYISFVWWIAKYCDFFYFFLFFICVCLHPHINTPAVNCEERSKLSTGGYQLTGRVHGLSERSIRSEKFCNLARERTRGILSTEVSARDGGRYVRNGGRPPPHYVRNGRRLKEKSLFDKKK